jgi:imidazolonepropionase-like amidohydrolase
LDELLSAGYMPGYSGSVTMLALRAAALFDGVDRLPVERPLVLVDSGRIVAVRAGEPPAGAQLVELPGTTVLPGLIDAHLHLILDASADPVGKLAAATDDQALDQIRRAARTCLAAGITTVRDLGDRGYLTLRVRDELAADPASGPLILAAGPPITTPGGHCWFLGGEAEGVDGVRRAVRARVERGVDVIKIMASGGEITPGSRSHLPQFGPDELRAAVDEGHRHGLPVTAHAHGVRSIADSVAAGVDMIEHCSFFTADGVDPDPGVIAAIAGSGVVVSATGGLLPGTSAPPRVAALLPAIQDAARRMRQAGITIVRSSDAGIGLAKPHDVLPYTVETAVQSGVPPIEALRSVTSLAATACRVGTRKGRVAPGYDADLLAVAGDPLADVAALRDVVAVFRAGHRVV